MAGSSSPDLATVTSVLLHVDDCCIPAASAAASCLPARGWHRAATCYIAQSMFNCNRHIPAASITSSAPHPRMPRSPHHAPIHTATPFIASGRAASLGVSYHGFMACGRRTSVRAKPASACPAHRPRYAACGAAAQTPRSRFPSGTPWPVATPPRVVTSPTCNLHLEEYTPPYACILGAPMCMAAALQRAPTADCARALVRRA